MQVVFRVDASNKIGTGHAMRCLTLASELKKRGADVSFICRDFSGNAISHIRDSGFNVQALQNPTPTLTDKVAEDCKVAHADWLGVSQDSDASECKAVLENIIPDWLIVDHYAIDYRWENKLKKYYKHLMVIDDLADRKHESDLLLDQTFGREVSDYNKLLPLGCYLLLGSQYALLRPEFAQWREYSLKRRIKPELNKILVTMGGVDPENMTGQVLDILKRCSLPEDLTVTIVMGASAPNIEKVKQAAMTMRNTTEVKVGVMNMAELMANADLAIGAAGATTWERCCLGLPTIQLVIAENQKDIAENLSAVKAIRVVDDCSDIPLHLENIIKMLKKLSLVASSITDGNGCESVCDYILSKTEVDLRLFLKPASIDDCEYVYSLQTEEARKYSRNPDRPEWDEHVSWFKKAIESEDSVLFLSIYDRYPVGLLRLENINGKEVEISIIVAPEYSGHGIAKRSLLKAFALLPAKRFKAVVHKDNVASKHVFEKLNFIKTDAPGIFHEYIMTNG